MEAETKSGYLEDYYVAIRCSNRHTASCFARLRDFLLSVINRLLYSLRKRFSKIVINGNPLCKEPKDLPRDIRRLSHRQLRKIKETLAKLDLGNQTNPGCRPGLLAPLSTPRSTDDDIEIEIVYAGEIGTKAGEEDKPTSYTERSDVHVQLENGDRGVNEGKKLNRKPRPKAAKGRRRSETAIPPYMIIDEESTTANNAWKRKRPKAAKGQRKACDPTDLPPELLIAGFKSDGCKSNIRKRPQTPIPRYKFEEEEDNLDCTINEILELMQSPITKRKVKKDRQSLGTIDEVFAVEEEEAGADMEDDDEDEDDIFNVPYLPKSQRKHAQSGLSMPWMK